jgi:hypothetical protein
MIRELLKLSQFLPAGNGSSNDIPNRPCDLSVVAVNIRNQSIGSCTLASPFLRLLIVRIYAFSFAKNFHSLSLVTCIAIIFLVLGSY